MHNILRKIRFPEMRNGALKMESFKVLERDEFSKT